mmetsp:Transcript_22763/g.52064  ORF Transcript_22763/g.52064 Transcript_22763/m.52064 type:complete len:158 (-) Transcript_22763:59-532(-)
MLLSKPTANLSFTAPRRRTRNGLSRNNGQKVQMTHNVAIIPDDKGGFLAVGGQYKNVKKGKKVSHAGIWLVHGTSWRFFDSRASGQARSHPPVELQRSVTASAREAMSEQTGSLSTFPQSATSTLFESPNNSYPSSNWGAARLILKGNHPGNQPPGN